MDDGNWHGPKTDWKALIAAAALVSSAIYFAGSLYRESVLSDVRDLIGKHAESATANRTEFFRGLESKAGGALDRLGTMESNCTVIREWRPTVDAAIRDLQNANAAKLQRLSALETMAATNATEHARLERRTDRIDSLTKGEIDQVRRNQSPEELQRRLRDIGIRK